VIQLKHLLSIVTHVYIAWEEIQRNQDNSIAECNNPPQVA